MREEPPLHLTRITIKNVRCFAEVDIDLSIGDGVRSWVVVFGDNGVGKTTLLRCVAMGLCDASSAAGLLREIYGDWNRLEGGEPLPATIKLEFDSKYGPATITTKIVPTRSGYTQVQQRTRYAGSADFNWDNIFACGYGAARRAFGSKDITEYATIDSVYTLFNYDTPLQNPELVVRRLSTTDARDAEPRKTRASTRAAKTRVASLDDLLDSLCAVLLLQPGSIRLTPKGLQIAGPWGTFQPVGGLGDGYQATLSWIADFLGWAMLYDEKRPLSEVRGIVLIDEIEQHLHPRWQAEIVGLLQRQFPAVQFIATTHTPMCAVGTTALPEGSCELVKLERGKDSVRLIENLTPPKGKRADQILTSMLFDLPTTSDDETLWKTSRFNNLSLKPRKSKREVKELKALRVSLAEQFSAAETPFETTIKKEVRAAISRQGAIEVHRAAANFEVMRQLREIVNAED